MMSGIRGKNTRPEMIVRRYLHAQGFRFRLHSTALPGKPDIVMQKYKLAIFVNGCFWHRHTGCRYATTPAENREKWQEKFDGNVARDSRNIRLLLAAGWRVIVIWECGLKRASDLALDWLPEQVRNSPLQFLEWAGERPEG